MSPQDKILWMELLAVARGVARKAYAPYSGLKVGAAAFDVDGKIVRGCNVEVSSYGLTLCAEVGLIANLHSEGGQKLTHVAITNHKGKFLMPCGRCRQLLFEFSTDDCIINRQWVPAELLPEAFSSSDLPEN